MSNSNLRFIHFSQGAAGKFFNKAIKIMYEFLCRRISDHTGIVQFLYLLNRAVAEIADELIDMTGNNEISQPVATFNTENIAPFITFVPWYQFELTKLNDVIKSQ